MALAFPNLLLVKSPGTLANVPKINDNLNVKAYDDFCAKKGTIEMNSASIHWWFFEPLKSIINIDNKREWRDVLSSILAQYYSDEQQRKRIMQSISGVIGSINSSHKPETIEQFYTMFIQRIMHRKDIIIIKDHPDFDIFLQKRFKDILSRR